MAARDKLLTIRVTEEERQSYYKLSETLSTPLTELIRSFLESKCLKYGIEVKHGVR